MTTNIIPARQEELEGGAILYSHRDLAERGQVIVRLIDGGIDIAVKAVSRGEALEQLADYFRDLGRQIRAAAWTPGVDEE